MRQEGVSMSPWNNNKADFTSAENFPSNPKQSARDLEMPVKY